MQITIKTKSELDLMRQAGKILADTLKLIEQNIYVGQTSAQLDKLAYDYITSQGAKPSFKGYEGFPYTICASVNSEVVHGFVTDIPSCVELYERTDRNKDLYRVFVFKNLPQTFSVRFQHSNLLPIAHQNGINIRNQRVHLVNFPQFILGGQFIQVQQTLVGHQLEHLHFRRSEAVNLNIIQIAVQRHFRFIPEHGVTGIKDRRHTNELQCMCVPQNTEIIEMAVGIRQNKVRKDLIFQERPHSPLIQSMLCADMDEVFIHGH